jgi:hypothetical protein
MFSIIPFEVILIIFEYIAPSFEEYKKNLARVRLVSQFFNEEILEFIKMMKFQAPYTILYGVGLPAFHWLRGNIIIDSIPFVDKRYSDSVQRLLINEEFEGIDRILKYLKHRDCGEIHLEDYDLFKILDVAFCYSRKNAIKFLLLNHFSEFIGYLKKDLQWEEIKIIMTLVDLLDEKQKIELYMAFNSSNKGAILGIDNGIDWFKKHYPNTAPMVSPFVFDIMSLQDFKTYLNAYGVFNENIGFITGFTKYRLEILWDFSPNLFQKHIRVCDYIYDFLETSKYVIEKSQMTDAGEIYDVIGNYLQKRNVDIDVLICYLIKYRTELRVMKKQLLLDLKPYPDVIKNLLED